MLYSILYDIFILSETIFAIDVENGVKVPRRIGFDGIMTFLGGYAGYAVAMFIAYYLLRSFGLYRMAKARGLENPKMCFVPFYAFIMLSRLRSDCNALKKHKFYPIVAISALGAFLLFSVVLDSFFSLRIISQLVETERIAPGTAVLTEEMFAYNTNLANVLSNLTDVSKIVYMVFVALLYCDLFRTYSPLRTRTHLTLSVIFTVLTRSRFLFPVVPPLISTKYLRREEFITAMVIPAILMRDRLIPTAATLREVSAKTAPIPRRILFRILRIRKKTVVRTILSESFRATVRRVKPIRTILSPISARITDIPAKTTTILAMESRMTGSLTTTPIRYFNLSL